MSDYRVGQQAVKRRTYGMALNDVFQDNQPVQEGIRDLAMAAPMLGFLGAGYGYMAHDMLTAGGDEHRVEAPASTHHDRVSQAVGHRHMDTLKTPDQIMRHQEAHQDSVAKHSGDKHANPNPKKKIKPIETGPVSIEVVARQITDGEGSRRWVYDDKTGKRLRPGTVAKGNRTVGIGFNMDQDAALRYWVGAGGEREDFQTVRLGRERIEPSLANELLRNGIARARRQVMRVVPDLDQLPQPAQLVLIDMAYNMGSLTGFNGMVRAVNSGDWEQAAEEMKYIRPGQSDKQTPWFQQVGQRGIKLYKQMKKLAKDMKAQEEPVDVNEALGAYSDGMVHGANKRVKAGATPPKKQKLDPIEPETALPKTERALERLYLDKGQGKWAHAADPRITVAMATPRRVYRIFIDGKHDGWIDFRNNKRAYHKKGEWEEPRDDGMTDAKKAEMMAYLEKIAPKKRRKVRETAEAQFVMEAKDAEDKKPSKADQAKVDAIVKDPKLPETAEDGKAYVVHWADGRGVFAVKKKSALQKWLNKTGSWADIVSIKYGEPVHGSKKRKIQVRDDIKEGVIDITEAANWDSYDGDDLKDYAEKRDYQKRASKHLRAGNFDEDGPMDELHQRRTKARQGLLSKKPKAIRVRLLSGGGKKYAVVHPSTKQKNKVQASLFDEKGAWGDFQADSVSDALQRLHDDYDATMRGVKFLANA